MRARSLISLIALVVVTTAVAVPSRAQAESVIGRGAERLPGGLYRLVLDDGTVLFTHGPDPVPDHGGALGPGDPERAPVCALDFYQHVLYGRLSSELDRYTTVKPLIQASIRRMNAVLNEESLASGDREADYKVRCDSAGDIQVDSFTAEGADFNSVVIGARAAGFTAPNADYSIFFDGSFPGVCGVASLLADESLEANLNNLGGGHAVNYRGCWSGATPMHENGHNQGATQALAPYSTGSGHHCYDENDVMCYSPDGGDANQRGTFQRCADRLYFDCGHDTYFDSAPEAGEYLQTHWNMGSPLNHFIAFGPPLSRPPVAEFIASCTDLDCSFFDHSTDGGAITWAWDFGDGATSSAQNPSHVYLEPGSYDVILTATDTESMSSSAMQTLTVPFASDPDPAARNLVNGETMSDRSGPEGTWRYYKIDAPAGRPSITFSLLGQPCILAMCHPNLDLYVRHGARPVLDDYDCVSASQRDDETCSMAGTAGSWYIGIYTRATVLSEVLGPSTADFTITATF